MIEQQTAFIIEMLQRLTSKNQKLILVFDNYKPNFMVGSFFLDELVLSILRENITSNIILITTTHSISLPEFEAINVDKLDFKEYKNFIVTKFAEKKTAISKKSLNHIINLTEFETHSTQLICSKLWDANIRKIKVRNVNEAVNDLLDIFNNNFEMIRSLLSEYQWRLLLAKLVQQMIL